ncbi:MAG: hypothetical protein QNK51_01170 [Chitinophagales bacterium]|nr:hypothetical protein [Chitinophagales bacterium]|tara:strand:- start:122 stop:475 length:354 start_codon:yes stop_codon:yes gene_type:complete
MKRIILLLIPMLLLISSCAKDPQDGSTVIWYGEFTALQLVNDGATSLSYTIGGQLAGSSASNVYYVIAPDCGENGSITYSNEPGSYSFTVKDQTDFIYWTGTIDLTDGGCEAIELTW